MIPEKQEKLQNDQEQYNRKLWQNSEKHFRYDPTRRYGIPSKKRKDEKKSRVKLLPIAEGPFQVWSAYTVRKMVFLKWPAE